MKYCTCYGQPMDGEGHQSGCPQCDHIASPDTKPITDMQRHANIWREEADRIQRDYDALPKYADMADRVDRLILLRVGAHALNIATSYAKAAKEEEDG